MPCSGECIIQIYEFRRCDMTGVRNVNAQTDLDPGLVQMAIEKIFKPKEQFRKSMVGTSGCQDNCECVEAEGEPIRTSKWQLYEIKNPIRVTINNPGASPSEYEINGLIEIRAKICNGICMPAPDGVLPDVFKSFWTVRELR